MFSVVIMHRATVQHSWLNLGKPNRAACKQPKVAKKGEPMGFSIRHHQGKWLVFRYDVSMFSGNLRQIEDWLDRAEDSARYAQRGNSQMDSARGKQRAIMWPRHPRTHRRFNVLAEL
jgi:hypothetical protein